MYVGMKNHMKTEGLEGKWCFKSYSFSQKTLGMGYKMHDETMQHTTADGSSHIGTPTSCYFVQTFCSNCCSDDQIHNTEASSSQRKYKELVLVKYLYAFPQATW